jgi:sarcosine oxidase subunit gamma
MAERRSALAHLPVAEGGGRVTLSQVSAGTILRIQAWPDTADAVSRSLGEVLGLEAPAIGRAVARDTTTLIAFAPGAFYATGLAPELAARVKAVPVSEAAVTDLSHARVILALEGEAAVDVLQRCVALDLSRAAFPPGRAAATMIHHIDVLIHRRSETEFHLMALRSFSEALAEWLLDAGIDEGIAFRR